MHLLTDSDITIIQFDKMLNTVTSRILCNPIYHMYVYAGPELGPLAGLMVGPEQGGWQVEEITVVSSRTGHVDRYLPVAVHSAYYPVMTAISYT